MRRMGMGFTLLAVIAGLSTEARAQVPGETVVVDSVVPPPPTVTYGERTSVRYKRNKTVIRERPVAYVTRPPAVVQSTRVIRSAPVVLESQVIEPTAPIVESRVIQTPIVESRVIQTPTVVETRYYRPNPVLRPRYYVPYP